jgi:hypothetical protein
LRPRHRPAGVEDVVATAEHHTTVSPPQYQQLHHHYRSITGSRSTTPLPNVSRPWRARRGARVAAIATVLLAPSRSREEGSYRSRVREQRDIPKTRRHENQIEQGVWSSGGGGAGPGAAGRRWRRGHARERWAWAGLGRRARIGRHQGGG